MYALVEVLSNDKSKRRQVYLAYAFGDQPPTPYLDGRNEWRIEDVGTVLDNGWRLFDHSLRKDVQRTFGSAEEGWSYVKLVGIRIRNALTISPIEFYAADAAVGSEDDSIS